MELQSVTQIYTGGPEEVDPGNYNIQQGENLVGLLVVFQDKHSPLLQYEHWYLYDKVKDDKWPQGTAPYVFASRSTPRVTTELSRTGEAPAQENPSQPSRDAFGSSHHWTEKGITARYILAKTEEQSPVAL